MVDLHLGVCIAKVRILSKLQIKNYDAFDIVQQAANLSQPLSQIRYIVRPFNEPVAMLK